MGRLLEQGKSNVVKWTIIFKYKLYSLIPKPLVIIEKYWAALQSETCAQLTELCDHYC